jgi:HEAT repeat protein
VATARPSRSNRQETGTAEAIAPTPHAGTVAPVDPNARAAAVAVERDPEVLSDVAVADPDARVRAVAIAALVRTAPRRISGPVWRRAAHDDDALVRRRSAEVAPKLGRSAPCSVLVELLGDVDAWVAEAAAYAIGEHPRPTRGAIAAVEHAATAHADPLVREAAVAALGAQGEPATLATVLRACDDKPAIRRRAVLALAAFDGAEVEARLQAALTDPDWQVRQAAEDLLSVT